MKQLSDLEIAQQADIQPIKKIAKKLGVEDYLELYGDYKAKVNIQHLDKEEVKANLILVTAINPTPAGEGKTTVTIGLGDALNRLGKNTVIALREPSLGPVFGVKGGATGGGHAQVVPMEDINLHFTGDFHAIGAANNLLAAMIDNHIHHGNDLNIDETSITWKRAVDMNDRQLRKIESGLGGRSNGVLREDGFEITVASEVMAILCLSTDIEDLKQRLGRIIISYNRNNEPVSAKDLKAEGAMAVLLKDAIKPNLVQTLEGSPALVHGGPFANIAHGCNSVIATQTAMKLGDYVVTEAGFGADLGAEKFLDIKCRVLKQHPKAVVIVATVRALKMHGGQKKKDLSTLNLEALEKGIPNLLKHIENIQDVYGLPAVVAINKFPTDHPEELDLIIRKCEELHVSVALTDVWAQGGQGGEELAREVIKLIQQNRSNFTHPYELEDSIEIKIEKIVTKIYGGKGVTYSDKAKKEIDKLQQLGYGELPICMAKTQYSLSDNPKLLGRPQDFEVNIRDIKLSAGAGFIVALTGEILTMPGLPKKPSANHISIDSEGKITGLF